MSIFEEVKKIRNDSLTYRDTVARSITTVLLGELETLSKKETLTDDVCIKVIKKMRQNAVQMLEYRSGDKIIEAEIALYSNLLPKQLTETEIAQILKELNTIEISVIMKHMKQNYAGLYDGKLVSEMVRSLV